MRNQNNTIVRWSERIGQRRFAQLSMVNPTQNISSERASEKNPIRKWFFCRFFFGFVPLPRDMLFRFDLVLLRE